MSRNLLNIILFLTTIFTVFLLLKIQVYAHEGEVGEVMIHVNEEGFNPAKVHIKNGETVTFENTGSEDHWPASDNHPSHTKYDGTTLDEHCNESHTNTSFDSCGAVKAGSSWSFTFQKDGVYEFHDHLWPHLTGVVIVGEPPIVPQKNVFVTLFERIQNIISFIKGFFVKKNADLNLISGHIDASFYDEMKNKYESIARDKDARVAIFELEKDSNTNPKLSALCHDMLHAIGHVSFEKYGSFQEAATYQSDFCNSGYIHGLFETYFHTVKDPLKNLASLCSDYAKGKRQFDLWQCNHGIGHGFMYLTGGDLDKSLELCDKGLSKIDALNCKNGVYMEVFNSEVLAKEKDFVDINNPFLTCSSRTNAKSECYLYVPTYLSLTKNMKFSDIFSECKKAESGYRDICIGGVGSEAMKRNMENVDGVFSLCHELSYTDELICIDSAVGMYMNQKGSYASGEKLCAQIQGSEHNTCIDSTKRREAFFR